MTKEVKFLLKEITELIRHYYKNDQKKKKNYGNVLRKGEYGTKDIFTSLFVKWLTILIIQR